MQGQRPPELHSIQLPTRRLKDNPFLYCLINYEQSAVREAGLGVRHPPSLNARERLTRGNPVGTPKSVNISFNMHSIVASHHDCTCWDRFMPVR